MTILPTQITLIPQYIFFRSIGWGGTLWPLIVPHFFSNAYNVFLLRQYFKSIPKDLDEAAMIDGATPLQNSVVCHHSTIHPGHDSGGLVPLLLGLE